MIMVMVLKTLIMTRKYMINSGLRPPFKCDDNNSNNNHNGYNKNTNNRNVSYKITLRSSVYVSPELSL